MEKLKLKTEEFNSFLNLEEGTKLDKLDKLFFSLFSEREKDMLYMRFGLVEYRNCLKPCTLKEIGEKYFIGRERTRQIIVKCLRKLRHPTIKPVLKEVLNG